MEDLPNPEEGQGGEPVFSATFCFLGIAALNSGAVAKPIEE
jgi:hypothetical protein